MQLTRLFFLMLLATLAFSCTDDDDDCTEQLWYEDADGDGLGNPMAFVSTCDAPEGYVADSTDTDDCPGGTSIWYEDADGDGFGNPDVSASACTQPEGYVSNDSDSDDTDENSENSNSESDLIGTWKLISIDYEGTSTTSIPNFPDTSVDFQGTSTETDATVTFSENPNKVTSSGSYTIQLEVQGVEQDVEISDIFVTSTWSLDGNTITVVPDSDPNDPQEVTIQSLTATDLVLDFSTTNVQQIEQGGLQATVTQEIDGSYTFEKQ